MRVIVDPEILDSGEGLAEPREGELEAAVGKRGGGRSARSSGATEVSGGHTAQGGGTYLVDRVDGGLGLVATLLDCVTVVVIMVVETMVTASGVEITVTVVVSGETVMATV